MVAYIKALFWAALLAFPVALFSGICAGALSALNFAIAGFLGGLSKYPISQAIEGFIGSLILASAPVFVVTFIVTFMPNLIGIFIIFLSNYWKKGWIDHASKWALYFYGGVYGIIIHLIAASQLILRPGHGLQDSFSQMSFFSFLWPAAILSGIIVFKCIRFLFVYKGPENKKSCT
ncbi:MAG: hypothetical protein ACQEQL_02065 [Pseudomonadota bacterium]